MTRASRIIKPSYERVRNGGYILRPMKTIFNETVRKSDKAILASSTLSSVRNIPVTIRMCDVVTPGYGIIRSGGGIVSHPMSRVAEEVFLGSSGFGGVFDAAGYSSRQTVRISGQVGANLFGIPQPWIDNRVSSNLRVLSETAAMAGMKSSSFQGFVFMAEFEKTVSFIKSPLASLTSIAVYIRQLRQAKTNIKIVSQGNTVTINGRSFLRPGAWYNKGPGRLVKLPNGSVTIPFGDAISGSVLAYNLGVKPMMMDWQALVSEIPNLHQAPRLTSRNTVRDEVKYSRDLLLMYPPFTCPVTETCKVERSSRTTYLYEDVFSIAQDFGVSWTDIPGGLWEFMTLSFIVDYFINIGEFLDACSALFNKKVLMGVTVQTAVETTTRKYNGVKADNYIVDQQLSGTDVMVRETKERVIASLTPGLGLRPVSKMFTFPHVQNLLSLGVQALSKLR